MVRSGVAAGAPYIDFVMPRTRAIAPVTVALLLALLLVVNGVATSVASAATPGPADPPHQMSLPSDLQTVVGVPEWRIEASELCRRYRCAASDANIDRLQRLNDGTESGSKAAVLSAQRQRKRLELQIRRDCLRELVDRGFSISSENGMTPERKAALEMIGALTHPMELVDAVAVLSGEGYRKDLVASESDVRGALFRALAADPVYGQRKLVEFGTTADDEVASVARESLPATLSPAALEAVGDALRASRERTINRAAMIAGLHPAGSLIPSLIGAQFAEADSSQKGDEAWIAIGKSTSYIAGLVPVVGNASGAFQPIPGVVYEGSVLRIIESAVTIYRTEVQRALVATVERTTGQPAPPFGFDRDRWMAWYRNDYPQLAQAFAREHAEKAIAEGVKTTPPRADG